MRLGVSSRPGAAWPPGPGAEVVLADQQSCRACWGAKPAQGPERIVFRMNAAPMPLRPRVALARAHTAGARMPAADQEQAPARIRTSAAIAEGRHCKGSLGVHGRAPQPSCLGPLAFRGRWLRSSRPQGSATCSSRIWYTQKRSPWTATRRDNPLGSSWCCRTSHLANGLVLDLGPSMAEPQGAPKQGTQEFVPVRRRTCWATLRQAAEQALEPNCCGRNKKVQMGIGLHWFS